MTAIGVLHVPNSFPDSSSMGINFPMRSWTERELAKDFIFMTSPELSGALSNLCLVSKCADSPTSGVCTWRQAVSVSPRQNVMVKGNARYCICPHYLSL